MKRGFYLVMAAQAFSSLADNALFIAAIALILELSGPDWMAPMMKWSFALAYVVLAAFVGAFADSFPKGRVMFITNALKVAGCMLMFSYASIGVPTTYQTYLVCAAYGLVGIGAAAYSPAKYGIVTEMLPPDLLVKGNSWIEGLTVLSIIIGTVLGGVLISPHVSSVLLAHPWLNKLVHTPAEAAILVIALVYVIAALCNLLIPPTHVRYPPQQRSPFKLVRAFSGYVCVLWRDKLGQISLAVTTLFWGAGATLQLIVIEWGRSHLGYRLDQASVLMGVAAVGTVVGSILAGRIPLRKALSVLPVGAAMGLVVLLMPLVYSPWSVYLLLVTGGLAGFFVVPMNALLQHRGHVLLSAGHSIAVQNFNEQLNILLMVAIYTVLLWLELPINIIIVIFGLIVTVLMVVFIRWSRRNLSADPALREQIGQEGHGKALDSAH
ncbi:lysophospholipid transporter LplT [Bordetella parapertussis]|uniref:Membrane protein n=2 Tax=Bordetella parapertussis TaxID=519 RepID=Q7W5D7_BORPA|nr:lysophospholipid transporter LplT [Bordetella parapertussis]AOB40317.1 lysophospholipid transporter LplT [Bordetella parapertussis]AUL44341.1 lysophospholipid transporter LplT [Bordetella parapertussis]AWP64245.1 lysophospholipid transporter LplT [Bordetella parapertussis]AWP71750.1 lysophospholipid transporter LplT [Bordetella parapertussis]AWP90353.1 lysophospholipid transporter LplT [Bordetella parapertussis]